MTYLKVVLTVIAALLAIGISSRCFIAPAIGQNGGEIMKVDIVRVDGNMIFGNAVPVQIK